MFIRVVREATTLGGCHQSECLRYRGWDGTDDSLLCLYDQEKQHRQVRLSRARHQQFNQVQLNVIHVHSFLVIRIATGVTFNE